MNEENQEMIPFHVNVEELESNTHLEGCYILQSASHRTTVSGKPFLSANLSDKTGSVPVIFWDYRGPVDSADDGQVVCISGQVTEFKGALQVTLEHIHVASEEDHADVSCLVPVAPIDKDRMYADITNLVDSMTDWQYQAVAKEFIFRHKEQFMTIPAAKSVHHSFLNGLLMHTGNMLKMADFLAAQYASCVNRDLLLTGTLLHDFSKREEFSFSALGLVSDYSVKGQLLGHLVMVSQEAGEICKELDIPEEKTVLLQHLLLSHHGKPEYGAAVVPMCAESELLSMIDMVDSRMEIYRENLEQTDMGAFSGRVFALDGHRVYRHYDPEQ